jgi:hypothetical protein
MHLLIRANRSCDKPDSPFIAWLKPEPPDVADCIKSLDQIKYANTYTQGSTVTFKTCSVSYNSASDIDGEKLIATAKAAIVAVIDTCKSHQGTYSADGPEIDVKKPNVKADE